MGLSKDKKALQKLAVKNAQQLTPRDILHNPVTLEFLGLESQEVYTETKLESYILNHLQAFLLEMGRGFCFEARQKRILIDQDYFKADLIFYHRILKCHVIIDLKIDRFRHEYASQLNLYMNYYKHEVMQADDNPPIGLLLCTDYGVTTVQYATEGLSQNLFVSKYRQLSICYEDFFGERCDNLLINPYCLKMFKRRWYVLAYVPSTNIIRRFGLDRIQKIKTTENTFKYPKDFSPEEYFRGFFGVVHDAEPLTIQLKAYREKPNYLRSLPLHLSQQEVETGTDYAVFEYKIAPTFDFIQEILLHGDQLEVLSPKSFREHVASIIKQMSDFYK